ncbi:MFS transporter [Nocardioides zeae]|uniref:MFS transporter n=1 Tax=Nocardioides zeae TaxID=1457234 RepID=A0A6P0HIU2_9ACTN|nr:MFS transporter [Nocardioides zeae]NEN78157.1 MFS transporter [Nocardioides zeae]
MATVAVALVLVGGAGRVPALAVLACVLFGWGFVAATSALIAWAAELRPQAPAAVTAGFFVLLVLGQALGSATAGDVTARVGSGAAFVLAGAVAALACVASVPRDGRRPGTPVTWTSP